MKTRRLDLRLSLAASAFFVSGVSALVYQVVWQRLLALGSGAGIFSIATIVAAFMAGLGIGSHFGGRLSARLSRPRALVAFAFVEAGIALFGALSPYLFYDLLYRRASFLFGNPWGTAAVHFVSLLLPTMLMGMSLPFLVRALVRTAGNASRRVAVVYGINVLGGATGAGLGPWVLMRHLGLDGALFAAAAGNVIAALLAVVAWQTTRDEDEAAPAEEDAPPSLEPRLAFGVWASLYALTGFVALGLEILWFRVMSVSVKSTSFTFGTVLALYLVGSGLGALVGAFHSHRLRRPLRTFLTLQTAVLLVSASSLAVLVLLPPDALRFFVDYWSGEIAQIRLGSAENLPGLLRLYLLLPFILFGVPTFLMGLSFPVLQRAVHDDAEATSRRVGALQAANIAGCTAGSLVVGLLGLELIGTTGSLRVLLGCGVLLALLGLTREGWRSRFLPLALLLAAFVALFPDQDRFWRRFHGLVDEQAISLLGEDASGVGMIAPGGPGFTVTIDGLYHSWLPFGGVHTQLGALGALVHPNPERVAVIGLASGDTPWALGLRPETRSVTVFEIFRSQEKLLHQAARLPDKQLDPLRSFLTDPRVEIVAADGRHALERSLTRWDVIESDALWPEAAFAGNLYSREFFETVRSRLRPGGVFVVWAPVRRVRRTLRVTFPEVICVDRGLCLASVDPVPLDIASWRARLARPEVRTYLAHPDRVESVFEMLGTANRLTGTPVSDFNEDLFPRDELLTPAQTGEH